MHPIQEFNLGCQSRYLLCLPLFLSTGRTECADRVNREIFQLSIHTRVEEGLRFLAKSISKYQVASPITMFVGFFSLSLSLSPIRALTYLGKYMDPSMKTDPATRMYQQVLRSPLE